MLLCLVLLCCSLGALGYNPYYYGCYQSTSFHQVSTSKSSSATYMSTEMCKNQCANEEYYYYGVEGGNQCYCAKGYVMNDQTTVTESSSYTSCSVPCAGNPTVNCGGSGFLALYLNVDLALRLGVNLNLLGLNLNLQVGLGVNVLGLGLATTDQTASATSDVPSWAIGLVIVGIIGLLVAVAVGVWRWRKVKNQQVDPDNQ
eukprot:TRINITY_DN3216_c0_g1_i1.p1 TRINITY_DN3216_c0_g1~~TRINITY_DN3216_c0_g1_i1.p1  ORF type:complete len:201 (+),score=6.28 TRINITY_DN3216_c0_g1_i1:18-620(+)